MPSIIAVTAVLAVSVQLLVVLMGYPLQIRELLKAESSIGIPVAKWLIIDAAHILWMVYSALQRDWAVFLPNVPGIVFAIWITLLIVRKTPKASS